MLVWSDGHSIIWLTVSAVICLTEYHLADWSNRHRVAWLTDTDTAIYGSEQFPFLLVFMYVRICTR